MARGRSALTDKEEKILLQAQLMGLSTSSMVRIGNRLRALEKEREDINVIDNAIQGFQWTVPTSADKLTIISPEGYTIEAVRTRKKPSCWNSYSNEYNITVSKPGTRFKPREIKEKVLYCDYDWKKRLMPGKSKELYSLIRWWHRHFPHDWDK